MTTKGHDLGKPGARMDYQDDAIEERVMERPGVGYAQYLAEAAVGAPHAGRGVVVVRLETVIGALRHVKRMDPKKPDKPGREPHHEEAAKLFKSRYEALYGGVSPAVDPAREPVDQSSQAHDAGMAARIDHSEQLRLAEVTLGKEAFDKLVDLLVLGTPVSAYADKQPNNEPNARQVSILVGDRLAILDRLAALWKLAPATRRIS